MAGRLSESNHFYTRLLSQLEKNGALLVSRECTTQPDTQDLASVAAIKPNMSFDFWSPFVAPWEVYEKQSAPFRPNTIVKGLSPESERNHATNPRGKPQRNFELLILDLDDTLLNSTGTGLTERRTETFFRLYADKLGVPPDEGKRQFLQKKKEFGLPSFWTTARRLEIDLEAVAKTGLRLMLRSI